MCEIIKKNEKYTFKYEPTGKTKTLRIQLEYKEIKEGDKYITIIYFPFYIRSSAIIKSFKDDETRAVALINSALIKKYKDIQVRDYNHREKYDRFKHVLQEKEISESDVDYKIAYSNGLNHQEKIGNIASKQIWQELDNKYKEIKSFFKLPQNRKFEFDWENFVQIILQDNCSYCGVSIRNIHELADKQELFTKRARGYTIEVDQVNPYDFYTNKNCKASCYWCNNAKTDEFLPLEFKKIAKGINCIWKQRGADIVKFNEIEFWKNQKADRKMSS